MGVESAYLVIMVCPVVSQKYLCLVYPLLGVHYMFGLAFPDALSLSKLTGRCIKVLRGCVIG